MSNHRGQGSDYLFAMDDGRRMRVGDEVIVRYLGEWWLGRLCELIGREKVLVAIVNHPPIHVRAMKKALRLVPPGFQEPTTKPDSSALAEDRSKKLIRARGALMRLRDDLQVLADRIDALRIDMTDSRARSAWRKENPGKLLPTEEEP